MVSRKSTCVKGISHECFDDFIINNKTVRLTGFKTCFQRRYDQKLQSKDLKNSEPQIYGRKKSYNSSWEHIWSFGYGTRFPEREI